MNRFYCHRDAFCIAYIMYGSSLSVRCNVKIIVMIFPSCRWAEIFQDGIGWIPFEAMPKYLDVMEQADALHGSEADNEYHHAAYPSGLFI